MNSDSLKPSGKLVWRVMLVLTGMIIVSASIWLTLSNTRTRENRESSAPISSQAVSAPEPLMNQDLIYPTDKLFIIQDRVDYESGSMTLDIPRLELNTPVLGDVDEETTLKKGVGLYDYAQPPGPGNRNVSIAGHRDVYGAEFLKIDTIGAGDLLYLTYQGVKYTYEYEDTTIVASDNWDPIRCKDFSSITLTSCDPIGTSLNRIIVTGRLIAVDAI
ncbi:class E sortase [Oscillospiraceae bacterium MB08-C2-2]|nr:class E sortase [Oscillospiraceae bacterium MB08-C2-2]